MAARTVGTLGAAVVLIGAAVGGVTAQSARGKLRVSVMANGEAAEGSVEVLQIGGGATAASGPAAETLDVPPGTYDLRVTLTQAIDDPTTTCEGVVVVAGAETAIDVDFEVSRLTLVCRDGDAEVAGTVRMRRPGAARWLPDVRCGETFLVSGGTYEAEVRSASGSPAAVTLIERLQVMSGGTQSLPLALR